jgi:hypothetical protein
MLEKKSNYQTHFNHYANFSAAMYWLRDSKGYLPQTATKLPRRLAKVYRIGDSNNDQGQYWQATSLFYPPGPSSPAINLVGLMSVRSQRIAQVGPS